MTSDRPRGDDDFTELPWASVFDPAANARALSAIQAQGFRAASRVVDRFAELAGGQAAAPREDRAGTPGLDPDVDLVISTWWSVIGQMFRAMRGESAGAGGEPASVDVVAGVATGGVHLVSGGDPATAEIWLRNDGADDVEDAVLRCSDLLAHDGSVIVSGAVHLAPAVVPMPARSSRGVVVSVDPPPGATAGHYWGTILVTGYPDAWLPLDVVVAPSEP